MSANKVLTQTQVHLYPEDKIKVAPVIGVPGRFTLSFGDWGADVFATSDELERIVAAIGACLASVPAEGAAAAPPVDA